MDQKRVFKIVPKKYHMNHQFPVIMRKETSAGFLNISNGLWKFQRISEQCSSIEEWSVDYALFLNKNHCQNILKDLSQISFPVLKEIYASENNIQSLQTFTKINAPNLTSLWIHHNKITSLRSLRKCNLPNLSYIRLNDNLINQFDVALSQLEMNYFDCLFLELNKYSRRHMENLRDLMKVQGKGWDDFDEQDHNKCTIYIFGINRIHQPKVLQKMQHKFFKLYVGVSHYNSP